MKVNNPTKHRLILERGYQNCNIPKFFLHFECYDNKINWVAMDYNNKTECIKKMKEAEEDPTFIKWCFYESK